MAHFRKLNPVGSVKIERKKSINDVIKTTEKLEDGTVNTTSMKYTVKGVSYLTPDGKIVTAVVNEGVTRNIDFKIDAEKMTVYTTTQNERLKETYSGNVTKIELPEKSIMTIVFE